jgi:hypothetical protein
VAFQNNGKKRGDRSCTKAAEIVTVTLKVATACSSKTLVSQILSISADSVLDPPSMSVILIGHIPCGLSNISSFHSLQCLSDPNSVNVKMEAACSPRVSVSTLILLGVKTQKFTIYYVLIDKHVMKYKGI